MQGNRGGSRGRGGRGRGRGGGGGYHNKSGERFPARDVEKINERFERYYNDLGLVPEGKEKEEFWAALRRELPNSFRFCGSKGYVLETTMARTSTEPLFYSMPKVARLGLELLVQC